MGAYQRVVEIVGVARGVADPREAGDLRDRPDEIRQPGRGAVGPKPVIAVDVLADQRELAGAALHELLGLRQHRRHGARDLGPAV